MFYKIFSVIIIQALLFQLGFCWFDIEMPEYKVLQKIGKNIEIRKYNTTKWACTSAKGILFLFLIRYEF